MGHSSLDGIIVRREEGELHPRGGHELVAEVRAEAALELAKLGELGAGRNHLPARFRSPPAIHDA